uniref:Uncharacterized protein n=1 Tax=Mesocestoides corti TaxID=53468 RepID=A0A5K3FZN4_MESCO
MEALELLEKQLRLEDQSPKTTGGREIDFQERQGFEISSCRPAPAQTTQRAQYFNLPGQPIDSVAIAPSCRRCPPLDQQRAIFREVINCLDETHSDLMKLVNRDNNRITNQTLAKCNIILDCVCYYYDTILEAD